jgi:hypothetical protein
MKHSSISLALTIFTVSIGIFSVWFFPLNGAPLAGMVITTLAGVVATLFALITKVLAGEGN